MENIIKLAGIEFTQEELENHYNNGEIYILTYRKIYKINKVGEKYSATLVYTEKGNLPITKRGRYYMWTENLVKEYYKI